MKALIGLSGAFLSVSSWAWASRRCYLGGQWVLLAASGWGGYRREEVDTSFTFNTLINVLLTSTLSHSFTWVGGWVHVCVRRWRGREGHSTRESRRVQLSEKTSHVVSGGQSTFAENPVLLLLIVVHISLPVCVTLIHFGSGCFLVFADSRNQLWNVSFSSELCTASYEHCLLSRCRLCRSLAVCVSHENVTSVDPEVRTVIGYGWIPHHWKYGSSSEKALLMLRNVSTCKINTDTWKKWYSYKYECMATDASFGGNSRQTSLCLFFSNYWKCLLRVNFACTAAHVNLRVWHYTLFTQTVFISWLCEFLFTQANAQQPTSFWCVTHSELRVSLLEIKF